MNTIAKYDTATNWSPLCNASDKPQCALGEEAAATPPVTTGTSATTSKWVWPTNCNYTVAPTTFTCTIMKLKGTDSTPVVATDGLIQGATLATGVMKTTSPAVASTLLYKDLDDADWTQDNAAAGTTKLADA